MLSEVRGARYSLSLLRELLFYLLQLMVSVPAWFAGLGLVIRLELLSNTEWWEETLGCQPRRGRLQTSEKSQRIAFSLSFLHCPGHSVYLCHKRKLRFPTTENVAYRCQLL